MLARRGILLVLVMAVATAVAGASCPRICSSPTVWGYGDMTMQFSACECIVGRSEDSSTSGPCKCGVCYLQVGTKVLTHSKSGNVCSQVGATDCEQCIGVDGSWSGVGFDQPIATSTPPSPTPTTRSSAPIAISSSSKSSMSTQVIVMIIVAVAVSIMGGILVMCWYTRRLHNRRTQKADQDLYVVVVSLPDHET